MGNVATTDDRQSNMEAVASRNWLRKESGLPPVEPQQEIERIYEFRERQEFERWMQSPLRYRVEQKLFAADSPTDKQS
jgi:hypothetical protein